MRLKQRTHMRDRDTKGWFNVALWLFDANICAWYGGCVGNGVCAWYSEKPPSKSVLYSFMSATNDLKLSFNFIISAFFSARTKKSRHKHRSKPINITAKRISTVNSLRLSRVSLDCVNFTALLGGEDYRWAPLEVDKKCLLCSVCLRSI